MRGRPAREEDEENAQLQEERSATPAEEMNGPADIEKIVLLPTWREMLMDLVHQQKLDPWNIDVVDIATKYLERIRSLQMGDLRVPANLILAAAILLRFKSDMLSLEEQVQQATLETYMDEGGPVEIPILELRSRIPPKRRVTLDELVTAMEKVLHEQQERENRPAPPVLVPASLEIKLAEFNMDEHLEHVRVKIHQRLDAEGLVTFSALLDKPTREETVFTLLPLLFLTQKGAISMAQDPFFGEIFIRLRQQEAAKTDNKMMMNDKPAAMKAGNEKAAAVKQKAV